MNEQTVQHPPSAHPAAQMKQWHRVVAALGCFATLVLALLDQNIVSAVSWTMVRDLDPRHGIEHLPWLLTAYTLADCVVLPLYGKLTDMYGAKRMYLIAVIIFLSGSAMCGLAQNMYELIAFRTIQGIGGGGLMSVTMVVLGLLFRRDDDAEQAEGSSAVGLGGVMVGLGIALGPALGGLVAEHLSWRWVFYINLPLGITAIVISILLVKLDVPAVRQRIDFLGAALIAAAAGALLLVSQWGGSEYAWGSPMIIALAGGGLGLLVVFGWWQLRTREPILSLRLLFNPTFRILVPLGFISGIGLSGSVAYISGYLQIGRGLTPTTGGLLLLPMAAGMTFAGLLAAKVAGRLGKYQLLVGYLFIGVAMLMFSRLGVDTPTLYVGIGLVILGIGLGQCLGVGLMIAQDSVGVDQLGQATTSVRFVQQLGAAFGLAFFGAVLNRTLTRQLVATTGGVLGTTGGLDVATLPDLPRALQRAAIQAFVYSTHQVFLIASAIMVAPIILLFFLRTPPRRTARPVTDDVAETQPGMASV